MVNVYSIGKMFMNISIIAFWSTTSLFGWPDILSCVACNQYYPFMLIWPIRNEAKILKKKTETLVHGYSYESTQRELTNEYQDDRV